MDGSSMALPNAWIGRLFQRLRSIYGNKVQTMFGEADADDLVATWAEGLGRHDAADLKRALDTMLIAYPDFPPTLPQFASMCRDAMRARMQVQPAVTVRYGGPAPEVLAEIHKVSSLHANRKRNPKDWARKLLKRELAGEPVNDYAVRCAKEALGVGGELVPREPGEEG